MGCLYNDEHREAMEADSKGVVVNTKKSSMMEGRIANPRSRPILEMSNTSALDQMYSYDYCKEQSATECIFRHMLSIDRPCCYKLNLVLT